MCFFGEGCHADTDGERGWMGIPLLRMGGVFVSDSGEALHLLTLFDFLDFDDDIWDVCGWHIAHD